MISFLRQTSILLVILMCGVLKLNAQDINLLPVSRILLCPRDTIHFQFTTTAPFTAGNVFTAELSSPGGSFSSPTVIGTLNSNAGGTILCTIPAAAVAAGGYKLRITASTPATESTPSVQTLTVKQGTKITAVIFNTPLCITDTLKTNTTYTVRPDAINWYFPNGLSSGGQSLSFFRKEDLTGMNGNVMVVAILNGCTDTAYKQIALKPHPDSAIVTSNSPICEGDTLRLTATDDGGTYTYKWLADDNVISTDKNAVIPNADTAYGGKIELRITANNGCRSFPSIQEVAITPKPEKPIATSNSPICEGENLDLNATLIAGVSYTWYGPFGVYANFRNPSVPGLPASATGYYTVIDSVGNCWNSDTIYAEIKAFPAKPTISNSTPVCAGDTMYLTTVAQPAGYQYNWTLPPTVTNITNLNDTIRINNIPLDASGTYILQVANGRCMTADTTEITVNPLPEVPVAGNSGPVDEGDLLKLNAWSATPGVTYSWTGPNNFSSIEQHPMVGTAQKYNEGTYTVTANLNGCTSSGITTVTVNHVKTENDLSLYPSPNNGNFTIAAKMEIDQLAPLKIFNEAGQVVYTAELQSSNKQIMQPLNLNGSLATGIYYLRIKLDGRMHKLPFTVVR